MTKKSLLNSDVLMWIVICAVMAYALCVDPETRLMSLLIVIGMVVRVAVKFVAVDRGSFIYRGEEYFVISKQALKELFLPAKSNCQSDSTSNATQNNVDAGAHFALAITCLAEGDKDSAITAYRRVEELDEDLAKELYDKIFS